MRIRFSEQPNPRYIHVNKETNTVHLLVPITTGTEIALDNTCRTVVALQEFFGKTAESQQRKTSAKHELLKFQSTLESDINNLPDNEERRLKSDRLAQVQAYLNTLSQIEAHPCLNSLSSSFPTYPEPIQQLLARPTSNLYAMHLRPSSQDHMLRTQNPTFTMNREQANIHTFQNALHSQAIENLVFAADHKTQFSRYCMEHGIRLLSERLPLRTDGKKFPTDEKTLFPMLAQTLSSIHKGMFGDDYDLDFTFSQDAIKSLWLDLEISEEDAKDAIRLAIDTLTEGRSFPLESSFRELSLPVNREKLSIMVQFLVGEINIYARARGLTQTNFGTAVLDYDSLHAWNLAETVKSALENGKEVEKSVIEFINNHKQIFKLEQELTQKQMHEIFERFNNHYQLVKASPHMDEFMILDQSKAYEGRVFTYQNNICFNFVDLLNTPAFSQYNGAENTRAFNETPQIPGIVPTRDSEDVGFYEVDIDDFKETMRTALRDNNFEEARKLIAVTENGQRVFEVLGEAFFAELQGNQQIEELFLKIRRGLYDAKLLERYNQIVRGVTDVQIILTPELARKLYVATAATTDLPTERTLVYSTTDAVKALLSDLNIRGITATAGDNGDIVIDTTSDSQRELIRALYGYDNAIHLTPSMAASLYKQVAVNYGTTSVQYQEMDRLNNQGYGKPRKLMKALELLDITVQSESISYPNNGRGSNGYIIKNLDQEALRVIEQTHEFQRDSLAITAVNQMTVARVRGFASISSTIPTRINPTRVQLSCPAHILSAFQEILRGSRVLGAQYTNPYTNQVEHFPAQAEQLTARHLQILARNEAVNVDGKMKTGLYHGLLDDNQIAAIRVLVKGTTVAGITYAEYVGGYGSHRQALDSHHKVIVIDQSGFQWQSDRRNTGGLFFYPDAEASELPANYAEWQRDTYQQMYNAERPEVAADPMRVSWNLTNGALDFDGLVFGFEQEFTQALDAAVAQGEFLDADERINFAFLRAGMGFFASGLGLSGDDKRAFEAARLQGILNALQKMRHLPQETRTRVLGKVGRIELPFGDGGSRNSALLMQIRQTVSGMGLEWGGSGNVGSYFFRQGWVTATTNCGDPHAMPSNEGGFSSVDAEMGSNAYLDHLNAAFNLQMTMRLTGSLYAGQGNAITNAQPSSDAEQQLSNANKRTIMAMITTLQGNISEKKHGREGWFNNNIPEKTRKFQTISNWLYNPDLVLNAQNQRVILALIRDVCAIKRNWFGIFEPHSLDEFRSLARRAGLTISDKISFTDSELSALEDGVGALNVIMAEYDDQLTVLSSGEVV